MPEFLDHLTKIGDFLLELTERPHINIDDTLQLKIFHHKIAEKTLLLFEYQSITEAQNNPEILEIMKKIDAQIEIIKTAQKSPKTLLSLLRPLILELDNILKPYVKEVPCRL